MSPDGRRFSTIHRHSTARSLAPHEVLELGLLDKARRLYGSAFARDVRVGGGDAYDYAPTPSVKTTRAARRASTGTNTSVI